MSHSETSEQQLQQQPAASAEEDAPTRAVPRWLAPLIVGAGAAVAVVLALIVLPTLRTSESDRDAAAKRYPPAQIEADRNYLGERVSIPVLGLRLSAPKDWVRLDEEPLEHLAVTLREGSPLAGWGSRRHAGVMFVHTLDPRYVAEVRDEYQHDPLVALSEAHMERSEADDAVTPQGHGTFSVHGIRVARVEEVRSDGRDRMAVVRYFIGAPFEHPFGIYIMCHEVDYDESFQRTFLAVLASLRALGS